MNRRLWVVSLFLILTGPFVMAQKDKPAEKAVAASGLQPEEVENFKKQAAQLINFMEFAFNTIGSSKTEYKEKDIIINQSYVKFFKDAKVQIEDDLAGKRDVVTNKDVQAYLKDIDFFFKEVAFKFTIEEITQEVNERGEPYFLVKTSRNLKGTSLEGAKVNDNQPRFIEINLDEASRDLKIVSIYTTRASEEEELISWWNSLGRGWRDFFSGSTVVAEEVALKDVVAIGRKYIVVAPGGSYIPDSLKVEDTLHISPVSVFNEIRRMWRAEQIDITGVPGIFTLEPLSAFTALRHLNVSGAMVKKLEPIRNLSKLESLNASGTMVASIGPLQYSTSLRYLDLSSTYVDDIAQVANFGRLEFLSLAGLKVGDISPISELTGLKELKLNQLPLNSLESLDALSQLEALDLSETGLSSLSSLSGLENLRRIMLERTNISDISPLAGMPELEYIFLDRSPVSGLTSLTGLKNLKVVYCDKTRITKDIAQQFMQQRPDVKVIYESEELTAWWQSMPDSWKNVFSAMLPLDSPPQREQLHEIAFLKRVDISGNKGISSLDPLQKLNSLTQLNASGSGISDLRALTNLFDLQVLDVSNTAVQDAAPLTGIEKLQELNISGTGITDLAPLTRLANLRNLGLDRVQARNPEVLTRLHRLEMVYGDGVPGFDRIVERLWDSIPGVLVVYQTPELKKWWESLDEGWKKIFAEYEHTGTNPDRVQLQQVASIRELDISGRKTLSTLMPLSTLKQLEKLNMSGVQIASLLPLGLITSLKELDCSNTPVVDISPLTTNRGLKKLVCANTPIKNIDPVKYLPKLESLDISGTQVTKLNALSGAYNLAYLSCFSTKISSLSPLDGLNNLKSLKVYNSKISAKRIDQFRVSKPGVEVVYY